MTDSATVSPRERGRRRRPLLRTLLGDVLRRIRLEQDRTLADVAGAARVSMPYLSELERGRKEASSEVLAAVCEALDVGLPEILAEVRRDLLAERAPQASVLSIETVRSRRASSRLRSGDVLSMAA